MPFVRVSWFRGRDQNMKAEIAADITRSITRHAGMDAGSIYVVFEDVAPSDWAVGGKLSGDSPADRGPPTVPITGHPHARGDALEP